MLSDSCFVTCGRLVCSACRLLIGPRLASLCILACAKSKLNPDNSVVCTISICEFLLLKCQRIFGSNLQQMNQTYSLYSFSYFSYHDISRYWLLSESIDSLTWRPTHHTFCVLPSVLSFSIICFVLSASLYNRMQMLLVLEFYACTLGRPATRILLRRGLSIGERYRRSPGTKPSAAEGLGAETPIT